MTNLVSILKHCPEGTKLYSPVFGEVTLYSVNNRRIDVIATNCSDETTHIEFSSLGRLILGYSHTECVLFPSKDQRDWSKFKIPTKKGDVIMFNGQIPCLVTGDYSQDKKSWVCGLLEDGDFCTNIIHPSEWCPCFYTFATKEVKDKLFEAMDKAGYTWDGETLKKRSQFKPFDKVLVRDAESEKWACTLYSHFEPSSIFHHVTTSSAYKMCIPFEGNEHLVGTTKNP